MNIYNCLQSVISYVLTHSGRGIAYAVGSNYPQEPGSRPLAISSNRPILAGSDGFFRLCEKADL